MNDRNKFLSLLLAVLMLATAVPGFITPVTAQTVTNVTVTDNNDDIFFIGETITVRWVQNVQPTSDPAIGIYAFNTTVSAYNLTNNTTGTLVSQNVSNGITYYTYEANFTLNSDLISLINETYPFHIYINASGSGLPNSLDLATRDYDLYVNYFDTPDNMTSVATGQDIEGTNSILLKGDEIFLNITARGTNSPTYGAGALLYFSFDDYTSLQLTGDSNRYYGTLLLSKVTKNESFTITNSLREALYWNISPNATVVEPELDLLPLVENNSNQEFVSLAYFVDNASTKYWATTLPYNISVTLSDGLKWVGTSATSYDYLTNNNRTIVINNTSAISNISSVLRNYNVSVAPGITQGQVNITLNFKNGTQKVIYTKTFDILPQDKPAVINVNPTSIVKGESVSISGAIANKWGTYNYTVVAINLDNSTYNTTVIAPKEMSSPTYYNGTWNTTTNWSNLPVGKYEIKLIIYSTTGDMIYNTSKNVTVNENLTLTHEPAPAAWGTYYPGDTVTFSGTFLRTDTFGNNANVGIKVYKKNATGHWVDVTGDATSVTVADFSSDMNAKTYNFTVTFKVPGDFKVLVNETDIPNVEAYDEITIPEHKVVLSETSSTINLGESVMIQVTTTADISENGLDITGAPLAQQVVEAEAFNTTTHTKVFNVTFTTDASVEPKTYDINITVPNGKMATYRLTVNDNLTIVDYPAKVVHGDNATIVAKAWANLTDDDYNLTVTGWGYNSGDISGVASGASYNETLGYRLINFTWNTSAYASPNWQTYPTHRITVTDGWVSDSVNINLINTSETTLDPLGTVYIGSTVNITGTTYLTPGTGKINITIENATPITLTATVLNEKVGDKYKFVAEWGPINLPAGVYNVTAHDLITGETYTIQVTVEGALTLNTDRDTYYPDGKVKIFGNLDDAASGTITFNITWFGGYNDSITATVENGSYEAYFNLANLPSGYTGDVKIDATYKGLVNATKTVTITDTPAIENVVVPAEPVKAGELFNITADTNLGINGTVALEIVKADNASVVKVTESVLVGEGGAFLYTVNTTNWTAGYYNVTLSKGNVEVSKQVYVYVTGANISLVEGSLVVEPTEGVAPLAINVRANVTNTGDLDGTYTAKLIVNNVTVKNVTVTVPFGEVVPVEFNYTLEQPGVYNVTIGDLTPVVVTVLKPATANFSNLMVEPLNGTAPLDITASAVVKNIGDVSGNFTVEFKVNGEVKATKEVELAAGANTTVEFTYTLEQPGVYNVTIDDLPPVQVTVEEKPYPTMDEYKQRVENASTVYFVFNNLGTPDAFSASQYIARTVPISVRTKSVLAEDFNMSAVNASDVVISVGGPKANPVTAAYEDIAPVHMVINGSNITIVTPNNNFTWTAPKPWWNATEGYFIIQVFQDNNTGAFVVTIYGTDADSTAAGAYYFMHDVYPNLANYTGIRYLVGLWQDTEPGADVPLPGADLGDTSGFSAGDTITIVDMG
jgi:hypothetical protein